MTFDECVAALDTIRCLAERLEANDDVLWPSERLDLYGAADLAALTLGVTLRSMRHDAAVALVELGVGKRDVFVTDRGTYRRTESRQGSDKWRGWALCDALALDLVEPSTGEVLRAVPVHVMRDTVSACADESSVSSRWRVTGLRGRVDVDRYWIERPVMVDDVSIVATRNPNEGDT
jgi:hypothetical protein